MNTKTNTAIQWIATGLVGFLFAGSAMSKFFGGEATLEMAKGIGLSIESFKVLGIIELLSVLLFIFPRTGLVGTLLLVAYMGGAIATHLTHGQSVIGPVVIEAFIWLAALVRFPELRTRLFSTAR